MPYAGLSLEGHVALVTGSARGIGQAHRKGAADAGADIAVSDTAERLEDARTSQEQVEAQGRKCVTYALDVLDVANIVEAIDKVVDDFGRLGILVNNAGIRVHKPALEVTVEDWDAVIDTNLKGVFFCAQAAARHMVKRGSGRIINIASRMGIVGSERRTAYCASMEWTRCDGFRVRGSTVDATPYTAPKKRERGLWR